MLNRNMLICCLLVGACLSCLSRDTRAADEQGKTVIMLIPREQLKSYELIISAVRSHFAGSDIAVRIEQVDDIVSPGEAMDQHAARIRSKYMAFGVFWCDPPDAQQMSLYLILTGDAHVLSRALADKAPGSRAESTGIIVFETVSAALQGGAIESNWTRRKTESAHGEKNVSTDPKKTDTNASKKPKRKETPRRLLNQVGIHLAYTYNIVNTEYLVNHGGDIAIEWIIGRRISVIGGYTFTQTIEAKGEQSDLTLRAHPIHAGLRFHSQHGIFFWGFRLELGFSVLSYQNSRLADDMQQVGDGREFDFGALPAVDVGITLISRVSLFLCLGAHASFFDMKFIVRSGAGEDAHSEVLLNPWTVRPRILVGVSINSF
ncbi:MAG: hypothetical protein JXX29_00755 [Deltaproteobacteria bacterium]|nr:hypothetical protein [Deltaproteobacteria bacterium]